MADLHAPQCTLFVEGTMLEGDVLADIVSVEFEQSVSMAAEATIVLGNPDNKWTDSPIFEPGNQVDVYLGYGTDDLTFVGRVELMRHLPMYPGPGTAATLQVRGYDRSMRMQRREIKLDGGDSPGKAEQESGAKQQGTLGGIVSELLERNGIEADMDPSLAALPEKFVQRKGTSDLETVRALANLYGADFFVEWEQDSAASISFVVKAAPGRWIGRFLLPESMKQDKKYTFKYGTGQDATLLDVALDWGLEDMITEVQAFVWDRVARDWIRVSYEESEKGKLTKFSPGTFAKGGALGDLAAGDATALPIESMTSLKLAVSGHSVDVLTRPFANEAEAARYAERWLKAHKDAFVVANGTVPGVAELRVGQTHRLEGLGNRYDGDYYFTAVRQVFTESDYTTRFTARKVIE